MQNDAQRIQQEGGHVENSEKETGLNSEPAKSKSGFGIEAEERFWSNVDVGPLDACWPWKLYLNKGGYGECGMGGKVYRCHRVAWTIVNGEIPGEMCVLHHCDNRPCCNPRHLFIGDRQANSNDMKMKGRSATGERNGSKKMPWRVARGSNHYMKKNPHLIRVGSDSHAAKLTDEDVLKIRELAESGNYHHIEIARMFGVCRENIGCIIRRESWKHI